jgi:hypothetical protein
MTRIIALFGDVRFNEQKKELGGITGHAAKAQGARRRGLTHEWGATGRAYVCRGTRDTQTGFWEMKKFSVLGLEFAGPIRLEKRAD